MKKKRSIRAAILTLVAILIPIITSAWYTGQNAWSECSENKAVIKVSFTNKEPKDNPEKWSMNVVAKDTQTGNSVDLGTVKPGETVTGTINTGQCSIAKGQVKFILKWTDGRKGGDTKWADYKKKNCCPCPTATPILVTPSPTPMPTDTPVPSDTPPPTASETPVPTSTDTPRATDTPTEAPIATYTHTATATARDTATVTATATSTQAPPSLTPTHPPLTPTKPTPTEEPESEAKDVCFEKDVQIETRTDLQGSSSDIWRLWIDDATGGIVNERNLTDDPRLDAQGGYSFHPDVSPDGCWVVFVHSNVREGTQDIWRVSSHGVKYGLKKITDTPYNMELHVVWAENGLIYFLQDGVLHVTDPDGRKIQNLGILGSILADSPDGRWLAIDKIIGETDFEEGKAVRFFNTADYSLIDSPLRFILAWTPDGQNIYHLEFDSPEIYISMFDFETQTSQRVSVGTDIAPDPRRSPVANLIEHKEQLWWSPLEEKADVQMTGLPSREKQSINIEPDWWHHPDGHVAIDMTVFEAYITDLESEQTAKEAAVDEEASSAEVAANTISPNEAKRVFERNGELWVEMLDGSLEWVVGVKGTSAVWNDDWIISFIGEDGNLYQTDQFQSFLRLLETP